MVAGLLKGASRRIFAAFALLVLLFAIASAFAMAGMNEIHEGLHEVQAHEEEVRTVLQLASAVRDVYAHEAHTIILGNATHRALFAAARDRAEALAAQVEREQHDAEAVALARGIGQSLRELDRGFRERLLPAVTARDRARIEEEHAAAQALVADVQLRVDRLAQASLARIGHFGEHASAVQHASVLWTWIFLAAAPLAAVAMGLYLGRSIARPMARLTAGAARIGKGDLETRIELPGDDEFARLAGQFNDMAASLKADQALLVQSERLASVGRLAAGVAHEINNPLTVILGYVRLLRRDATDRTARDLAAVEAEAIRCQEIVEGLLDLSRPRTHEGEPVELREVAEEVVTRLREAGQLAGVEVHIEGRGTVSGDAARLRQIALNLIKNGAEAAAPRGEVQIRIAAAAGAVLLSVSDSGPGLSAEQERRLFEPFYTTKPSGTGLGLAVSRALAHAHGGEIEATRAAPRGAVFTLRLPAEAA